MNSAESIALANLLATAIPAAIQVYSGIQAAHADQLKPIADVLAAATSKFQGIEVTAQAELAKLKPAS